MKEFTTAVEAAKDPDDKPDLEFNLDGRVINAYYPGDGQLAYLMAATASHKATHEKVAGLINFFVATLDEDSSTWIANRLLDRTDEFGVKEIEDIFEWMTEQWSGRPTKQPSDFQPSQQNGGPKSKRRTPART